MARRGGARSSSISLERLSRFRYLDDLSILVMIVMVGQGRSSSTSLENSQCCQYCDHLSTTGPPSPLIGLLLAKELVLIDISSIITVMIKTINGDDDNT